MVYCNACLVCQFFFQLPRSQSQHLCKLDPIKFVNWTKVQFTNLATWIVAPWLAASVRRLPWRNPTLKSGVIRSTWARFSTTSPMTTLISNDFGIRPTTRCRITMGCQCLKPLPRKGLPRRLSMSPRSTRWGSALPTRSLLARLTVMWEKPTGLRKAPSIV